MSFFVSWIVSIAFIILVGVVAYPIIRSSLRLKRFLGGVWWRREARSRALEAWQQVSTATGLAFEAGLQPHRLQLTGDVGGVAVVVESFHHKDEDHTRIVLQTGLDPEAELFFVEAESGYRLIDSLTRRDPSYVPDQMKRYDLGFMALGDALLGVALLDDETRREIDGLVVPDGLLHLSQGQLIFERLGLYESHEVLQGTIEKLQELAHRLSLEGRSIESHLLDNFRTDADAGLRLHNLKALLEHYPTSPEAQQARATMLDDPAPEVRLFGAMQMGEEGLEVIKALADDRQTPEGLRIDALKYLAQQIKEHQSTYAVRVMLLLLNSSQLNAVAVIPIARAIERFGSALDEETCLDLLAWNGHPRVAYAVKVAACKLLMRCGGIGAVEPLMEHLRSRNKELREAADKAILHIQSRLGSRDAGGLSLLEDRSADGALSTLQDLGTMAIVEQILRIQEDPELQDGPG